MDAGHNDLNRVIRGEFDWFLGWQFRPEYIIAYIAVIQNLDRGDPRDKIALHEGPRRSTKVPRPQHRVAR